MKPKTELWNAIYQKRSDGSGELVALLKRDDHAAEWHANPGLFFNCKRNLLIQPSPIRLDEYREYAIDLLDRILNGPDEDMPIDEAKAFLKKIQKHACPKPDSTKEDKP